MLHRIKKPLHFATKAVEQQRREESQERVEGEPVLSDEKTACPLIGAIVTVVNKLRGFAAAMKERVWARRQ